VRTCQSLQPVASRIALRVKTNSLAGTSCALQCAVTIAWIWRRRLRAGAWGKEYVYALVWDGACEEASRPALALTDPDTLAEPA
jgi:hypothetical protein